MANVPDHADAPSDKEGTQADNTASMDTVPVGKEAAEAEEGRTI